jgi:hypothetical protein
MPTQLNVVILQNSGGADGGTTATSTVTVPISAGLQSLDSGNSSGQGQASGQSGYSSVDEAVRNLFRANVFFVPSAATWYPVSTIQSVTWT